MILANFFWIGLALNISGHFSFYKTQLSLKSVPEDHRLIAKTDADFQLVIDVIIAIEIGFALGAVALVYFVTDQILLNEIVNSLLIVLTLLAFTMIITSYC